VPDLFAHGVGAMAIAVCTLSILLCLPDHRDPVYRRDHVIAAGRWRCCSSPRWWFGIGYRLLLFLYEICIAFAIRAVKAALLKVD
jgi:hypothetical protein